MQGLFGAFQSVVDPGDEVLVFSPFWTPIKDLIAHCQGSTVLVPSAEARRDGFSRDTGALRDRADARRLLQHAAEPYGRRLHARGGRGGRTLRAGARPVVFADEAYEDLVYEGEHVSIASLEGMFERTITCYTLSKSYAMTGWRVGYAVAAEPWMSGIKKCLLYSTNGVSTPSQYAAVAAFQLPPDFYEDIRREATHSGATCSSRA